MYVGHAFSAFTFCFSKQKVKEHKQQQQQQRHDLMLCVSETSKQK
jgi:thiamine pyrophosphokinase